MRTKLLTSIKENVGLTKKYEMRKSKTKKIEKPAKDLLLKCKVIGNNKSLILFQSAF